MQVGDLVWCLYHIYFLPAQGIILRTITEAAIPDDIHYEVLIEGEIHTLTREDMFLEHLDALECQMKILKVSD